MDITFLNEYFIPVIVGICLCVGYVIKTSIPKVNNSLIPAVLPKSVRLSSCHFHALRHTPAIIRAGRISCFSQPVCYLRSLFYHT